MSQIPVHYTLMLMRDDGHSRRLRMRGGVLRTITIILVLLPILTGVLGWFSWKVRQDMVSVRAQYQSVLGDLEVDRMELERLLNVESFLKKNDPNTLYALLQDRTLVETGKNIPSEMGENSKVDALLSAAKGHQGSNSTLEADNALNPAAGEQVAINGTGVNATEKTDTAQNSGGQSSSVAQAPDSTLSTSSSTSSSSASSSSTSSSLASSSPETSGSASTTGPVPAIPPASVADNTPKPVLGTGAADPKNGLNSQVSPASPGSPESEDTSLANPPQVSTGLVRVENMLVRRVGTTGLRISFDLYNAEQQAQVSGKTEFELIMPDGTVYPLDTHGDTTFRIKRLKKIVGNPTIPQKALPFTTAQLRITVLAEDSIAYSTVVQLN